MIRKSKLLLSGKKSEESIHIEVMDFVRLDPSISRFIMHVPNGGVRSKSQGNLFKRLGVRAGASDLFVAIGNHGYFGLWLELKSYKGRISPQQKEFMIDMTNNNYLCYVAYNVEEAINYLKWYCFE